MSSYINAVHETDTACVIFHSAAVCRQGIILKVMF